MEAVPDSDPLSAGTPAGAGEPEGGAESYAPPAGRIVVGVDDSEQAAAALRWALEEAALRKTSVEVVHTWAPPVSYLPLDVTITANVDDGAIDAAAREFVDDLVAKALQESPDPSVPVQVTILPGSPALVLTELAADADLVVVGSHGRTGIKRFVLGSVAMSVVQHAPCPTVVVRVPDEDG
jgi:nucleotide-binding universal stress UspA family protein